MIARHLVLLFGALVWFGAMYGLAANGAFVSAGDEPPLTLAAAFLTTLLREVQVRAGEPVNPRDEAAACWEGYPDRGRSKRQPQELRDIRMQLAVVLTARLEPLTASCSLTIEHPTAFSTRIPSKACLEACEVLQAVAVVVGDTVWAGIGWAYLPLDHEQVAGARHWAGALQRWRIWFPAAREP